MSAKTLPSLAYLYECLNYDRKTGIFVWKTRPRSHFMMARPRTWLWWNNRFSGKEAGSRHVKGYWCLHIDGSEYKAHRVAWKMSTGEDPLSEIDHKDGNKGNNRLENLRIAVGGEQNWNKGLRKSNTSGRRGVNWHRRIKQWAAAIGANGTRRHLGYFDTIEAASCAYESAARKLHGEFYRPPQGR